MTGGDENDDAASKPVVTKSSPLGKKRKVAAKPVGEQKPASKPASKPAEPVDAPRVTRGAPRVTRGAPRSLSLSKGLIAAGLIACVVLSAFFLVATARIHHTQELRDEYSSFAERTVTRLLTLDADNADEMYDFAMTETSGRAQQMFRDNMKQVADLVRQGDAKTETKVLAEGISRADDAEGTALMVIGWADKTASPEQPVLLTYRWKVDMTRINGDLKLTNLEFVQ